VVSGVKGRGRRGRSGSAWRRISRVTGLPRPGRRSGSERCLPPGFPRSARNRCGGGGGSCRGSTAATRPGRWAPMSLRATTPAVVHDLAVAAFAQETPRHIVN